MKIGELFIAAAFILSLLSIDGYRDLNSKIIKNIDEISSIRKNLLTTAGLLNTNQNSINTNQLAIIKILKNK